MKKYPIAFFVVWLCFISIGVGIGEDRKTPLILKEGGTPDQPVIFDGKGTVIDLGIDLTAHSWKKDGDLWSLPDPHPGRKPPIAGQVAGLFVDEIPIVIPRDLEAEKVYPDRKSRCYRSPENLRSGEMGYGEDGSLYFRWPEEKEPGKARLILPGKPGTNCVSIACSHIVIRNLTVKYAGNDGFNIHGDRVGIRLENVQAFCNADEGISAHGTVKMKVNGAEIAWNGSAAGGAADVGDSVTGYEDCTVHDNAGAAFYFSGKCHSVRNSRIYNQERLFSVQKGTGFIEEGNRTGSLHRYIKELSDEGSQAHRKGSPETDSKGSPER